MMKNMSSKVVISISKRLSSSNAAPNIHTLLKTPNKYNDKNSAFNFKPNYPKNVGGIFYNPAPSAPTPGKTPDSFLPAQDPRKSNPLYNTENSVSLEYMPELRTLEEKKYHMTKEEILELQKLRDSGMRRKDLIEKFGVSNLFLSLSTDANKELLTKRLQKIENRKSKWSQEKVNAKDSKSKRTRMWLRDEY